MKRLIAILFLLPSAIIISSAQQVKEVTVSDSAYFEETLQYPFDDKGLELRLRLSFDEENDRLELVLVGSRTMMVFRQDVRYRDVFGFWRNMKPEKLPFRVLVPPGSKYRLTGSVWKGFRKKRKNHIFNSWLENVSAELVQIQPATSGIRSAEAMMVTDSIVQRFGIGNDATDAYLTLRNLMVTDVGKVHKGTGKVRYDIVMDQDMNTSYHVIIRRDPCFRTGQLIDSVRTRTEALGEAYRRLATSCPNGVASSVEEGDIFNQHRLFLLSRYPAIDATHECRGVQELYDRYNALRDSLEHAPCSYSPDDLQKQKKAQGKILNAEVLVNTARSLDLLVSKILLTSDIQERLDLIDMGDNLIRSVDDSLSEREVVGEGIDVAMVLYRRAKSYFYYSTVR